MIIGLDSASPRLIDQWIDVLPNLRSLRQTGVSGVLESVIPPSSVPAWQCFATGKNPAKIGLWGFLWISRDRRVMQGGTTRGMGCIWDLCSNSGMRVGVLNIPGTYPPYPVNGFMVSGFPTPPGKVWAYPANLARRLDKAVDGYEIDVPLTKPSEMRGGEEAYLAQVRRLHYKSVESARLLIDWYDPDFFIMTLQGLDLVQHDFARYMDQPDSKYSNVVRDWYILLDKAVGELKTLASANAIVMALSDHGSIPVSTSLHINEFFRSKGMLAVRDNPKAKGGREIFSSLRRTLLRKFPPDVIRSIYQLTPHALARNLTASAEFERMLTSLVDSIDWSKTKTFSTGGHQAAIYLNYDYKNGESLADRSRRAELIESLREMLSSLTHPKTHEPLRAVFHLREDTFQGPEAAEAPDLCLELFTEDQKIHFRIDLDSGKLWSFSPHLSSEHVRDGFWSLSGPGIRPGLRKDASILDLAPTLLNLLGLRVPEDCDGKVLNLSGDFGSAHAEPVTALVQP